MVTEVGGLDEGAPFGARRGTWDYPQSSGQPLESFEQRRKLSQVMRLAHINSLINTAYHHHHL